MDWITPTIMGGTNLLSSIAGGMLSGSSGGLNFGEWLNRTKTGMALSNVYAREGRYQNMTDTMKLADKFGIHPLAMLGNVGAGSPGYSIGTGKSSSQRYDFSSVGRSISSAISGERRLNNARTKLLNAQAEALESQNKSVADGLGRITTDPVAKPGSDVVYSAVPLPYVRDSGTGGIQEAGIRATTVKGMDEEGNIWTTPSKQIEDPQENAPDYHIYRLGKKWIYDWPNQLGFWTLPYKAKSLEGKRHRASIRLLLQKLQRDYPPGKGYEYVWNASLGLPKRVKGNRNVLYSRDTPFGYNYIGYKKGIGRILRK